MTFADWCGSATAPVHVAIGPFTQRYRTTGSDGARCSIYHVAIDNPAPTRKLVVGHAAARHDRRRHGDPRLPDGADARGGRRQLRDAGPHRRQPVPERQRARPRPRHGRPGRAVGRRLVHGPRRGSRSPAPTRRAAPASSRSSTGSTAARRSSTPARSTSRPRASSSSSTARSTARATPGPSGRSTLKVDATAPTTTATHVPGGARRRAAGTTARSRSACAPPTAPARAPPRPSTASTRPTRRGSPYTAPVRRRRFGHADRRVPLARRRRQRRGRQGAERPRRRDRADHDRAHQRRRAGGGLHRRRARGVHAQRRRGRLGRRRDRVPRRRRRVDGLRGRVRPHGQPGLPDRLPLDRPRRQRRELQAGAVHDPAAGACVAAPLPQAPAAPAPKPFAALEAVASKVSDASALRGGRFAVQRELPGRRARHADADRRPRGGPQAQAQDEHARQEGAPLRREGGRRCR